MLLPNEIIYKIILYLQHPICEIVMKPLIKKYNIMNINTLKNFFDYYKIIDAEFPFYQYYKYEKHDFFELLTPSHKKLETEFRNKK